MRTSRVRRPISIAFAALLLAGVSAGCGGDDASTASSDGVELVGLFRLTPGAVEGDQLTGTYFRMLQPDADIDNGPYMINANSPVEGGQATLLAPGTSGGLRTGGYQSEPSPGFDADGNSLANAITMPTKWFNVDFSISTNPVDPQTKTEVAPPTVVNDDGQLTADLSSWAASWNGQEFNQGAPKPVSSTGAKAVGQEEAERVYDWVAERFLESAPEATVTGDGATGTYDPETGAFVLEWTSYIEGGAFNSFTGLWHLEGVFEPAERAPDGS
ncbi:MAG: hypothetical protein M3Z03_17305 [Actinomycetota bacterium]|nr:hypothetical protein [Actinomycetota bacterium]